MKSFTINITSSNIYIYIGKLYNLLPLKSVKNIKCLPIKSAFDKDWRCQVQTQVALVDPGVRFPRFSPKLA